MKKKKIIAIANQKGGVAKTTTAINIGAGLVRKGKNVLLVDTDNQCHLSRWLGYDSQDGKPTVSELIWQTVSGVKQPVDDFIRHNDTENIDYIPSNFMLAGIISILGTDSDSTSVFARLFSDDYFNKYDYIIIDCPPTLDLLVSNALKACDKVLIPVQSDYWAYEGVDQLLATLQRVKTGDIRQYILGILVTMFNKRTNSAKEIMSALTDSYKDFVFENQIAYRDEVKVSSITHKSLVSQAKSVTGQQYMAVVDEIIEREDNNNG